MEIELKKGRGKDLKLLEAAKQHLNGEKVNYHLEGLYKSEMLGFDKHREAVFILTDEQVFLYCQKFTGFESESIPFSTITSEEVGKGFTGHKVKIISTNNTVELIYIRSTHVNDFVTYVKGNIGINSKKDATHKNETGLISVADEILKFKGLLDIGVITQEEFEKKKIQLLES